MPPTSRTARTTNSASTTCVTTWSTTSPRAVSVGLYFAIVDEVDSILIDEARTPLIISGPADDNTDLYRAESTKFRRSSRARQEEKGEGDYWVDEKAHQVYISESGHVKLEKILAERGLVRSRRIALLRRRTSF